ncbi:MAG: hypothetical protein EZS28_030668 [Streblomastix strix]|uniref:Uncharacterized protein n=1 Tax=Streblomastix strix TaxID=222440 RepID=A0A5J4UVP0_9EUKA|nr:MAG: hypothetical protein EZS28_030668 [Streblomastix strix]
MHKVLSTISGPAGMIHPGIGGALGAGANLAVRQLITNDIAYYIQYSKRGGSSGGMMQNDEYQLFIDYNNALVYAANNQIIDGMASDYALKIEPNGLLTIKNLKVINFDFVAQINQLINQVNLLQQSIGTTEQDITDIKNDIDTINQELSRQTHFRGYYLLNTDIQNLPNSANGDFAFSAESGTVWMFDANWYNSGDIVPDQVTPASDALPIVDGTAAAGISTEYSRGDHVHPLNITSTIPVSDSASGSVGTANYYARSDHSHPINITTTISPQDSASGAVGTTNYYARSDHSHPINVETNASNIPIVNGVGANGTSAFYARQDHVHPQQLTYDGNVTATKFIKAGGLATEILCANGDTTAISTIDSDSVKKTGYQEQSITGKLKRTDSTESFDDLTDDQYTTKYTIQGAFVKKRGKTLQYIEGVLRHSGDDEESEDDEDYITRGTIYNQYVTRASEQTIIGRKIFKNDYFQLQPSGTSSSFAGVKCGLVQINPNRNNYNQGLRIARSTNNYCGIYLGCDPNSTTGTLSDQWNIANTAAGEFRIGLASQVVQDNKGLIISADGNTLSFNGSVIAGTGATNGASNGSVNYSAGNPILWGVNSVGTEGGFYSNGTNICWRARPVTLGSVPP